MPYSRGEHNRKDTNVKVPQCHVRRLKASMRIKPTRDFLERDHYAADSHWAIFWNQKLNISPYLSNTEVWATMP